jgi:hypothetical protein
VRKILVLVVAWSGLTAVGCQTMKDDPVLSTWDKPASNLKTTSPFASYTDK